MQKRIGYQLPRGVSSQTTKRGRCHAGIRLGRFTVTTMDPWGVAPTWIRESRVPSSLAAAGRRISLGTMTGLAAISLPFLSARKSRTH
jgi:hypothetical protein